MVLLKSPFLIILQFLPCKTQNILSDAPSIKLFQKELSYIFKSLFDSAYCYIPDLLFPFLKFFSQSMTEALISDNFSISVFHICIVSIKLPPCVSVQTLESAITTN